MCFNVDGTTMLRNEHMSVNVNIWTLSQPHFEASVRMKLALPKVGTWSPPGFPQLQSSIVEVKTPRLDVFFIPLERPWSLDVWNGLAWAIQTFAAQVMVKRKAGSQTGSLTPDHKKSAIDPIPVCAGGVQHRWKALEESYKFSWDLIPIRGLSQELWAPKVPGVQTGTVSELLLRNPGNKRHLDVGAVEQHREYYIAERWWLPPSPGRGESSDSILPVVCPNTKTVSKCELTNL